MKKIFLFLFLCTSISISSAQNKTKYTIFLKSGESIETERIYFGSPSFLPKNDVPYVLDKSGKNTKYLYNEVDSVVYINGRSRTVTQAVLVFDRYLWLDKELERPGLQVYAHEYYTITETSSHNTNFKSHTREYHTEYFYMKESQDIKRVNYENLSEDFGDKQESLMLIEKAEKIRKRKKRLVIFNYTALGVATACIVADNLTDSKNLVYGIIGFPSLVASLVGIAVNYFWNPKYWEKYHQKAILAYYE